MKHQQDDGMDPYDWPIDRVIAEVAADDEMLTSSLRINEVDGEVLLTVCTYERLKTDIGIIPMGKRSKIMRVIEGLRRRSEKYMDYIQDLASGTALPDDAGSVSGYSPPPKGIQSLKIPHFTTSSGSRKRKSRVLSVPPVSPPHPSGTSESPQLQTPPETVNKRRKPLSLLAAADEFLPLFVPKSAMHLSSHSAVRIVRDGETGAAVTVPFSQESSSLESASLDGMDVDMNMSVDRGPERSPSPTAGGDVRIENRGGGNAPISISPESSVVGDWEDEEEKEVVYGRNKNTRKYLDNATNDDRPVHLEIAKEGERELNLKPGHFNRVSGISRRPRYLPVKGLPVDEVMYGKTEVGDELLSEEDNGEFCIVSSDNFPGQRRYVERQIRYLLREPESVTEVHKGHLRTGIKPYKEDLVLKHYRQAVTLISVQTDGSCTASRENTTTVTLPWSATRGTQTSSSDLQIVRFPQEPSCPQPQLNLQDNSVHDWDYLTKWQNIDDDIECPRYGDSGSDGEYSVETWAAMEAERGPLERSVTKSNRKPLTVEEVQQVLAEGVNVMVKNWREKVLPKKEAQAWHIYRTAKKRKERKKTARDAKVRVKELEERLQKMRNEIATIEWTHKGNIKKQVKILQPTVQDREEQKWLAGLMEKKKTPEKPEKLEKLTGRTRVIERTEGGEWEIEMGDGDDEESLGSTSEDDYGDDEDEGMDGFIVPDTTRDAVDGREVEVEGEKEVEAELARKATENELIDSDESSEDDVPRRVRERKERGRNKVLGKDVEIQEDQPMTGMGDDDEDVSATEEETVIAPKLDKGKGKGRPQSPTPRVKQEPPAIQLRVIRSPTSMKDIPIIDLTIDDSPQKFNEKSPRSRKSTEDIPHIEVLDDDEPDSPLTIVTRMVADTSQNKREAIWYRIEEFKTADLFSTVAVFARQIHQKKVRNVAGLDEYEDLSNSEGALILKHDSYNAQVYMPIARYYCAWVLGKTDTTKLTNDEFKQIDELKKFTKFRGTLIEVLRPYVDAGPLKMVSEPEKGEPSTPRNNKRGVMARGITSRGRDLGGEESDGTTTGMTPTASGHRKRPRKEVVEDVTAKAKRELLDKKMRNMARRAKDETTRNKLSGVENAGMIRINIGKYVRHNDIFFHPSLAEILKPHQVEGIRFMWQQLVQTGENRGALLAHTMGLGKTLQVIALLYTLATAGCSDDKKTYDQIPEHLRVSKTLVLSPPGLVENWSDEFDKWLPVKPDSDKKELDLENIGDIIRADCTVAIPDRQKNIAKWYNNGGVLLMGYQTFRTFVQTPVITEEGEDWRYKQMLLDGPNIIIADEAHQLKNPATKISEATRGFRSMSRIAMTGSPLSNNLLEYWSMIDWIDPLFLGPRKEFEQKYVQPINDGLYADSSIPERRKCLKMLTVLKNDIGPKVHRMDISVIQHDLPPKTEFLIKVPLTALQLDMYRRFLKDPTTTGRMGEIDVKGPSGNRFFDVIHLMSQICNHPLCFVETLNIREKGKQELRGPPPKKPSGVQSLDDESEDIDDTDSHVMEALLNETNQPYPWARAVMDTVQDKISLEHSYKMLLVKSIIKYSIEAGDQVLLFTHSALTLRFLEGRLEEWGYGYAKIDGKTLMSTRQTVTKNFNAGVGGSVCLISTEAGGLGLNLPGANRIIIFDFKWSPMWEEQAIGRGFRLGQKKHVFVYRFHACGTYEEIMRNKVLFKNQLHSRVVDKRDPIRYATKQGKQYFKEPYEVKKEDLTEFKGKDPMILDKILERVDFIRSIEYTDTFPRDDENDVLTPEELCEIEEMLQAEKDIRKAQGQGQQVTDSARKVEEIFRKLNSDVSKLAEQAEFAKQAELQIEKERFVSESAKLDNALAAGTIGPPGTQAVTAPRPRIMVTLPLPRTMGRIRSAPNGALRVVGKNRDTPPLGGILPNKPPAASALRAKPNPKYGHPPSSQLVPPPPPPPVANKFKLDISKGLPSIFMSKGKDGAEKINPDKIEDNPDSGGGNVKGVASVVSTLKL